MTRNAGEMLDKCIRAIKKGVPSLNKLIIIDGGSSDGSISWAYYHGADIIECNGGRGLGKAREIAINNVSTPFFGFIDVDVKIPEDWEKQIRKYWGVEVGAVESTPRMIGRNETEKSVYRILNEATVKRINREPELKGHSARGFTGATLIRTDAVKDIEIPAINCLEDWIITQHILKKGYRWLRAPVKIIHYDRMLSRPYRTAQVFATSRALGRIGWKFVLRRAIRNPVIALYQAVKYGSPIYFIERVLYTLRSIDGFLNYKKYLKQKYAGWEE